MLLVELLIGIVAVYIGGAILVALTLCLPFAALSAIGGAAARRVDRRQGRPLSWSAPVEDIAKALVAEQAMSFRIAYRRALRTRELEFLFVPLSDVRRLTPRVDEVIRGSWHVFCQTTRRGCVTVVPISGLDLAAKLVGSGPDALPAAEALDCLMSTVYRLAWALA